MKKVLSLVLALVLVLGMMPVFAADTTATGADQLYKYGFISGDNGDLMVNKVLTRGEMAVLVAQMNGLKDEAANYAAPADFSDVAANAWYAPYVAYGQANGWWAGYPDGTFKPDAAMSGQEFAAVLMNALKYDYTWNTVVADASAIGVNVATTNFNRGAAFDSMWAAVNMPVKGETVALGVKLGKLDAAVPTTGDLAVTSVKASTAKSFTVTFNRAVADTDKVTLKVTKGGSAVTTTTAWNEAKTEAVLSTASNLAEATFDVTVMADTKELAKESIAITAQKVAKIQFTSQSVAVEMAAAGRGFVTYKVFDQYGNDITTNYLANNISFTTGAGTYTAKNGLLTITPNAGTPLLQLQNISIVAYDNTSNVSATATLPATSQVGTLKSFTLGSPENLKLAEGDVTSVYYLPYTAVDMSGNETKNYDLVKAGLIDADTATPGVQLTVSLSNYVTAQLVQDPSDSSKAAIEVKATATTGLAMDMPVNITAMSYAGGTSTVETTISKVKTINSITLLAPSDTVSKGENPTIDFEAYDQYGNKVTKYSDINGNVTFTNLVLSENTDGTAKLTASVGNTLPLVGLAKGTTSLTAVVSNSGKMSTLTLNVQAAAVPSTIKLDTSSVIYAMEVGATQDFTVDEGDMIAVYDQYDREMSSDDIDAAFGAGGANYVVNVSAVGGLLTSNTATITASGGTATITAPASACTDTLQFSLYDVANAKTLSTVQASIGVIATDDIVDYTIDNVTDPIYASIDRTAGVANAATARDSRYDAEYSVYGKTNSGAKVLLAGTPIDSSYVSNSDDFVVTASAGAYDAVTVNAIKPLDLTKTGASTVVTVNVYHNNKLTALTTDLTSSTAKPVAASISVSSASNDDDSATQAQTNGMYVVDYLANGTSAPAASFKFRISDQYGSRAMAFSNFKVIKATNAANASIATTGLTVSQAGQLTVTGSHVAGNSYWISASTDNGLVKTVKLTITD